MKFFFSLLVTFPMIWVLVSLYIPSGSTIGRLAPAFTVSLTEQKEIRLIDFRNKVVFLNFWASWCPPCQAEARDMEAAWRAHKDKKVVFLGINIQDDEAEDAIRYLKRYGITYSNGWDDGSISRLYSVWAIPKTYIIGPKGKITYVHLGRIKSATIMAKLGEAKKGVVTAKEGRGPSQSLNVIRIDELAKLLEGKRNTAQIPPQASYTKDEYRKINILTVNTHRGRWAKILMKDGIYREGKIMEVNEDIVQLEQNFNSGTFSIRVPIQQVEEVQLLVLDGRADVVQ